MFSINIEPTDIWELNKRSDEMGIFNKLFQKGHEQIADDQKLDIALQNAMESMGATLGKDGKYYKNGKLIESTDVDDSFWDSMDMG